MGKLKTWMGRTSTGARREISRSEFVHSMVFTNKTFETMTLNIFLQKGDDEINLCPNDMQIAKKESYVDQSKVFTAGDTIVFTVDKDCAYHFSIEERE